MFEVSILTLFLAAVAVLLAVTFGLFVRDFFERRKQAQSRRLGANREKTVRRLVTPYDQPAEPGLIGRFVHWTNTLVANSGSGMEPAMARVLALLAATAIGGLLLLGLESPVWALGGFVLGFIIPLLIFNGLAKRRMRFMESQLPEALNLLARAVRAGESPDQAIHLVANETPRPLGNEFALAARQMDMGLALPLAMKGMARRTRMGDLRLFATTLMLHRQTGGNLAMTLERLATVMRDRLEYRRTFRASTAGGRMSMLVIATSGVVALLYFIFIKPDYITKMFAHSIGIWLLFLAGLLLFSGIVWISSMLKSEY